MNSGIHSYCGQLSQGRSEFQVSVFPNLPTFQVLS